MFGIQLPSVSDIKNTVAGAASSALHTTEDLGSSAVSHAASLGRDGLDLGRAALSSADQGVRKAGSAAMAGIGRAQQDAENGTQTSVMRAGQGVHAAANAARSHTTGDDPLSRLARGAITATEDTTRFDLGVAGGVGKAAVGLVGSAGKVGVLAAEHQASPSARAAIDAKVVGLAWMVAKAAAGYVGSVAQDPSRVLGDASHVADAGVGWVEGEAKSAGVAIKEGHGPESFGLAVGNIATYAIPVAGEARLAGAGLEVAARGAGELAVEGGARSLAETGMAAAVRDGAAALSEATPAAASGSVPADLIAAARADQVLWGYAPDEWGVTQLSKGDKVYGGLPGASAYYTDAMTFAESQGSRETLFQSLQVQAHPEFGYRPQVGEYEVTRDMTVPSGEALANPAAGAGGGHQFFVGDYAESLRLVRRVDLGE